MAFHQQQPGDGPFLHHIHPRHNDSRMLYPQNPGTSSVIAFTGAVLLQGGGLSHLDPGEVVRPIPDRSLPLFVPRKTPLSPENETMERLRLGELIIPCGDSYEKGLPVGEPRKWLEQTYGRLSKIQADYMSPSSLEDTEWHDDEAWLEHVRVMHNLVSKLANVYPKRPKWLEDFELDHLLKIGTYQMEKDVAVLKPFRIFVDGENNSLLKNEDLEFGGSEPLWKGLPPFYEYGSDEAQVKEEIGKVRVQIVGKRWLVAPFNLQSPAFAYHWGMTIFDRLTRQLYIFDSMNMDPDYLDRMNAVTHAWARFWHILGFPFDFQFFVPAVTPQVQGWECGYLSVTWALLTLRKAPNTLPYSYGRLFNINLGSRVPEQAEFVPPSLSISDWTGHPLGTVHDTLRAQESLKEFIFEFICNELGIPKRYEQAERLQESVSCINTNRSWVPRDEHLPCDAEAHQTRLDVEINSYQLSNHRIMAIPQLKRYLALPEECQNQLYARQAEQQLISNGDDIQSVGVPSAICHQSVAPMTAPAEPNEEHQSDGSGTNTNGGRINNNTSTAAETAAKEATSKAPPKGRSKATVRNRKDAAEAPVVARITRSGRHVKPPARYAPEPIREQLAPKPKLASRASHAKTGKGNISAVNSRSGRDGTKGSAVAAVRGAKPTKGKSKKRALVENDPNAMPNASSEAGNTKKRKLADPPAATKSAVAAKDAHKQKKAKRTKR